MAAGEELKKYSREEVKIHNNVNSCWMIIDNKVYDITKFLDEVSADRFHSFIF